MSSFSTSMDLVEFIGKLGDLKEDHYNITLAFSAMIELMIDKGLISREELDHKTAELDQLMTDSPYPMA